MSNPLKIEVLFPEFCNQGGDNGNVMYLKACLKDAEFIETSAIERPAFADGDVSMVILGSMTENEQEKSLEALRPHRDRLAELMHSQTVLLFTGNAAELLGEAIFTEDGRRIEGLNLLPFTAKRDMEHRFNGLFVGSFESSTVIGFKSQFTMMQGENADCFFCKAERGIGLNPGSALEGFHVGNLFATWLLGPLLVMNPDFTRYLLDLMGASDVPLLYEKAMREAFEFRLAEFRNPKIDVA